VSNFVERVGPHRQLRGGVRYREEMPVGSGGAMGQHPANQGTEGSELEGSAMPRLTVNGIADDMLKASELDGEAFYAAMKALDARVRAKVSGRAANLAEVAELLARAEAADQADVSDGRAVVAVMPVPQPLPRSGKSQ
jgi:hypothetical protein